MRTFAVRLPPGADLKAELQRLTARHALRAGCILTCVGSLSSGRLRLPAPIGRPESYRTFDDPMEILSLTGTLCPDGLHVHITLAAPDGAAIGGHLASGCIIHTTAELVLADLPDLHFHRRLDPATGYPELTVLPAGAEDEA